MKKAVGVLFSLVLMVQLCFVYAAAKSDAEFAGYLVRLAEDPPMLLSEQTQSALDYVLPGLYQTDDLALAEMLLESGAVESVEPNYIIKLFDYELYETEVDTSTSWTDVLMQADYAADLGLDGTGVRVAVIDSGLDAANPNLQNANIAAGYDYVMDSAETMSDGVGHGTRVTQMIVGDGKGNAVKGVAPKATIVPLRCFSDSGAAQTDDLLRAMSDAVNVYDCDVVNMSWGFAGEPSNLAAAMQEIINAGAIAVAAAGNASSTQPQGTLVYPAAYESVVGIGSVDSTLTVVNSSQKTAAVDACAPGGGVPLCDNSGKVAPGSGTSFAAPCVAGAAALIRQLQPEFTTASFRALIADRAVDLGAEGYDTSYGHGFVRMDKLLEKSWMFDDGGAIGWLRNDGSTLVKAGYETSGKMLAAGFMRTANAIEALTKPFAENETAAYFLTDKNGIPLTKEIRK